MTIFGFNTDVKLDEVVYHVQSEARQADFLLQTLVFVKGQCIGKRVVSYAQKTVEPDFSEQAMHEFLKLQHKAVLDAIQQGRLDSVLGPGDIQDVGEAVGLTLNWLNTAAQADGSAIALSLQVLEGGKVVPGARLTISPALTGDAPPVASAVTDATGTAVLTVPLTQEILQQSAVIARASHAGKSATRKFRFKK